MLSATSRAAAACQSIGWLTLFQQRSLRFGVAGTIRRYKDLSSGLSMPGKHPNRHRQVMNRNILYFIVGALVVVVAVLGYQSYQDHKEPDGLQINVGKNGIDVKNK